MKKLLLFSLCICLLAGLQAQEPSNQDQYLAKIKEQKLLKFKAPSDTTFLLDSTLSHAWNTTTTDWDALPNYKNGRTYDAHGRLSANITFNWNFIQNKWIYNYEYLNEWDDHGNMTEWIYNNWDTLSGTWIPYEHDTLWYNNLNIMTSDKWYFYNPNKSSWMLGYSEEFNDAGGPVNYYSYYWNDQTFLIAGGARGLYTLNAFNKPIETLTEELDTATGNWLPYSQVFSDYTSDTVLVKQTLNYWNGTSYILSTQNLYTYTDGLITEVLYQYWDANSSLWVNSFRQLYTYGINHKETEYLYQNWSDTVWKTRTQRISIYDASGNRVEYFNKRFSITTGLQLSGTHYITTYNSHNLITQDIRSSWDAVLSVWINNSKVLYYYSPFYGIQQIGINNVLCKFENPYQTCDPILCPALKASENFRMSVYSMSGACVYQSNFNGGATVSINKPLANGLYMLVILDGKGIVYSNKLLIRN